MSLKHKPGNAYRIMAGLLAASLLSAASCILRDVGPVSLDVTATAHQLEDEEDITFGEWLLDELQDLDD